MPEQKMQALLEETHTMQIVAYDPESAAWRAQRDRLRAIATEANEIIRQMLPGSIRELLQTIEGLADKRHQESFRLHLEQCLRSNGVKL